jgi:hypothetical protein
MIISFGSAIFKIARLLFIALLCVHLFACAFYRVKKESAANQEDVENFYLSRNTKYNVRVDWQACEFAAKDADVLLLGRTFPWRM